MLVGLLSVAITVMAQISNWPFIALNVIREPPHENQAFRQKTTFHLSWIIFETYYHYFRQTHIKTGTILNRPLIQTITVVLILLTGVN